MSLAGWLGKNDRDSPFVDTIKNVLLVRQSERLGNLVLLGLAINALKTQLPQMHIACLVPQKYRLIADINRSIDEVIALDKKRFLRAPWQLFGFIRTLKNMNFDIAIDCSDDISKSATAQFYTLIAGARRTAGHGDPNSDIYNVNVGRSESCHSIEMYLHLFENVFNSNIIFDADRLARNDLNPADPVIINIGGRGKKRWALDNFIALAKLLSKKGLTIRFMIGPEEAKIRVRLAQLAGNADITSPTSLKQLVACLEGASGFISSDAGPMHLAWSLGLPTLAIFLTSSPQKYRPLGRHSAYIDGRTAPVSVNQLAAAFIDLRGRCL